MLCMLCMLRPRCTCLSVARGAVLPNWGVFHRTLCHCYLSQSLASEQSIPVPPRHGVHRGWACHLCCFWICRGQVLPVHKYYSSVHRPTERVLQPQRKCHGGATSRRGYMFHQGVPTSSAHPSATMHPGLYVCHSTFVVPTELNRL